MSIWTCHDFISCAVKKISRASFNARSSSSFICILSCWIHVPPVFIPSLTAPEPVSKASVKELELEVELMSFLCIFWCFSPTKKAPIEILCSETLHFRKSYFSSVPEFGVLLGEWSQLLMSGDLTAFLTLNLLSLDSDTYTDTSVLLIVILSVEGK